MVTAAAVLTALVPYGRTHVISSAPPRVEVVSLTKIWYGKITYRAGGFARVMVYQKKQTGGGARVNTLGAPAVAKHMKSL